MKMIDDAFMMLSNGQIYKSVIGDTERILIERALERTAGNQIMAARLLGLNRNTLRTKIRKLCIQVKR